MEEIDLNEVWYVCPFKFYGYITKKKESLKAHLAHRHDVGIHPFQNKCDCEEAYQEALDALEQPMYVCFLCDSGLNSFAAKEKEDLLHHLTHDHAIIVGLYECPYCDYKSEDRSLVRDHISNKHTIKIRALVGYYKCPYCDHESEDRNLVRDHIWNTHIKTIKVLWEKQKCPFCDFKTEKTDDLSNHLDNTH